MLGPRRVLDLFADYYPEPRAGRRAARPRRPARRRGHALAPPLGRRAATALPRPGAGRAARGGLPRRADGGRRPRGPHRCARRRGRAQGEGRVRRPHHPRAGRGRADGGPHRDPLVGPRRAGGHAAGPDRRHRAPGRRPAGRHVRGAAGARRRSPWPPPSDPAQSSPRRRPAATGWRRRRWRPPPSRRRSPTSWPRGAPPSPTWWRGRPSRTSTSKRLGAVGPDAADEDPPDETRAGRARRRGGAGAGGGAGEHRPPRALRPLTAQTGAEIYMTLRRGETLLLTLGIPVVFLLFFSKVSVVVDARRPPRPISSCPASWPSR